MKRISVEKQDNCVASDDQLNAYLAEPDDKVAARLSVKDKRLVATCILYGINTADAQLQQDRAELREIKEKLERHKRTPEQFDPRHPFLRTGDLYIPDNEYQSFWEKHLGGK